MPPDKTGALGFDILSRLKPAKRIDSFQDITNQRVAQPAVEIGRNLL